MSGANCTSTNILGGCGIILCIQFIYFFPYSGRSIVPKGKPSTEETVVVSSKAVMVTDTPSDSTTGEGHCISH